MTSAESSIQESSVYEVVNPATEEIIAEVELAGTSETDAAIARAARAYESWRAVAPADRGRLIAVAATGYDVIDIAYCKSHGIAVANIRNYAVHTVPEHAFMLILALRRNLPIATLDVELQNACAVAGVIRMPA